KEPDSLIPRLEREFVTTIEQYEHAILGPCRRYFIRPSLSFGGHSQWSRSVAEFSGAAEDVGECVMRRLDRKRFPLARTDGDIEIDGLCSDIVYRPGFTSKRSTDHSHLGPIVLADDRDIARFDLLIPWLGHFERCG